MISTLLVTGANNHDWERTAPYIAQLLNGSGRFAVTVAEDASAALEGDLSPYQLILLDYNGPEWTAAAQTNFLRAVATGAGVTVYHAANNPFKGWTEYEKLVGLLWREGTGHGQFHEFTVAMTEPSHPIVAGIADFKIEDELYHKLVRTPGSDVHTIATAFSSPESGGSGADEPMLMVGSYGQGRVFHTALGHVWPGEPNPEYRGTSMVAVENPGFQQTLLRGCEWAATGAVA